MALNQYYKNQPRGQTSPLGSLKVGDRLVETSSPSTYCMEAGKVVHVFAYLILTGAIQANHFINKGTKI